MSSDRLRVRGKFTFTLRKSGLIVAQREFLNTAKTGGLNDLLEAGFRAGTQRTAWYIGLVDNNGFTSSPAADTMSSHAGWTEITAYAEATRQAYSPAAASAGAITNSGSLAVFTINDTKTLRGAFITTGSAKSGTTGILWSVGILDAISAIAMTSGHTLDVRYDLYLLAAG